MMSTSLLLRIASVVTILFFAGHTAAVPWTPSLGPEELRVIEAMKGPTFDVAGSTRTYWDFYLGFGLAVSYLLLLEAVVLWQLASLAKTSAARLRPIIAAFFFAFAINIFLAWKYFFIIPLSMSIVIAIVLASAFYTAGKGADEIP